MASNLKCGDKVKCLAGNISHGQGAGEVGYVTGFARFSPYHGREAYVSSVNEYEGDSGAPAPWCGWFWVADLEPSQ